MLDAVPVLPDEHVLGAGFERQREIFLVHDAARLPADPDTGVTVKPEVDVRLVGLAILCGGSFVALRPRPVRQRALDDLSSSHMAWMNGWASPFGPLEGRFDRLEDRALWRGRDREDDSVGIVKLAGDVVVGFEGQLLVDSQVVSGVPDPRRDSMASPCLQ